MEGETLSTHLRLLVLPTVLAILAGTLWYFVFWRFHLHVDARDADTWKQMFNFASLFHSLLATVALGMSANGHMELRRAKRDDNRELFQQKLKERIPLALKILLFVLSFVVMTTAFFMLYHTEFAGINVSMCVAFMLAVYWEVAINLDDPVNGVWYRGWIDKDWLTPSVQGVHE